VTDNIAYNMLSALYAIACRLSVRMSVRLSHTILISQKRLKLGLCNFHHTIAPSFWFLRVKCHPKIVTVLPEPRHYTRVEWVKLSPLGLEERNDRWPARCWLYPFNDEQIKKQSAFMSGRPDLLQRPRNFDARGTFCAVSDRFNEKCISTGTYMYRL